MIRKDKLIWLIRQEKEVLWTFMLESMLVSLNILSLSSTKKEEEGEIRKKSFDISNSREGFSSLLNELGLLGEKEQIK